MSQYGFLPSNAYSQSFIPDIAALVVYRNRCRHDIVRSVLEACREEAGITEICRKAGLPVDRGRRIVDRLLRYGLLVELQEGKMRRYRITPRGYEWLGIYESLEEVLPPV